MAENDEILQALRRLKLRLSSGEIDEPTYHRQRELILADLSPEERALLGTASPTPQPAAPQPGTPRPITGSALGPTGGSGRGLRTSVPTLADLELGPGTVLLGQWRLERELGRGGFGAVFEAEELHLHERQAVKVLDPGMVAREDLIARFRREVSLMRKLVHPRIVRVYDYREDLEQLVALISMELVVGGSVNRLLTTARARQVEIPVPLSLSILRQTLEALAGAHGEGVIHRDVTPGNILLAGGTPEDLLSNPDSDPKVKLVDFGIAGLMDRSALSRKSRVSGTAAYVAPEVLDPSEEVTPAADVYGAGAMAYEALTGKLPLGRFAEPSELRKGLSEEVNDLVLELLQVQPAKRPRALLASRDLQAISARAGEEAARRSRIVRLEIDLDAAVERDLEQDVVAFSGELEHLLATGERNEALERARRWQRLREVELQDAIARSAAAPAGLTRRGAEAQGDPTEQEQPKGASDWPEGRQPGQIGAYAQFEAIYDAGMREMSQDDSAPGRTTLFKTEAKGYRNRSLTERLQESGLRELSPDHPFFPRELDIRQQRAAEELAIPVAIEEQASGMAFVLIPGGESWIGSRSGDRHAGSPEGPIHLVRLRPYYCGIAPVLRREWARVLQRAMEAPHGDSRPIENVSWEDVQEFLLKINDRRESETVRLLSEAEWEHAARGGTQEVYWWGNRYRPGFARCQESSSEDDSCVDDFLGGSSEVGRFPSNAFGLLDVLGNVWEWVEDQWHDNYEGAPIDGSAWISAGSQARVLRGGSWYSDPRLLRVSSRFPDGVGSHNYAVGFRCAISVRP